LVKHLRPNVATIAVMEAKSKFIEEKFETFASELRGAGIEPKLMTLEPRDFSYQSS
jgi:hypothetical protein